MKTFFKENFALIIGTTLPLVLILLFLLAGEITKSAAADPQYGGVFIANYHPNRNNQPYKIKVEDGNIVITENDPPENPRPHYNPPTPTIYTFDHKTMQANRVNIDFDNFENGTLSDDVLEKLNEHYILTNLISSDGYEFYNHRRQSSGVFGSFFGFDNRSRYQNAIKKNGRIIPVRSAERIYNPYFLGWITDNE